MESIKNETAKTITRETFQKTKDYHNPSLTRLLKLTGYDTVEWKARGAIITDIFGKDYIDCAGGYGVFNIGHSHPKVIKAVQEQLKKMSLSSKVFLNKPLADLAELIAKITPGDLQYSFFCNSGAEAVEGALKLARVTTGRTKIISTHNAFHGKTFGALSATGKDIYRDPFKPLVGDFIHVPFGDIKAMQKAVCENTAAVIVEPIQGEGGIIVPPDAYLPELRKICDEAGVLLIVDEIQTGLGRTGKMFAVDHYGVVPDIITLAKALSGGVIPIGAFTGTSEVWEVFNSNPLIITSTFGGNPLACVAAKAAIEVVLEENLCERAVQLGDYLMAGLRDLQMSYPNIISEIRGKGLMIGFELTKEGLGGIIIPEMAKEGITAVYTLNNPKVIRFEPPLVITENQLDKVLQGTKKAIEKAQSMYNRLFKLKGGN
ncbi:aminotransferase class III-fold pyridoxal phosphate-dependent enzyme [Candidatus Oleimmundimicrobium sp.]|uniref:aspartate aminotransferase family protein n=1 Tax=Candidatus Oleimmundimicrobium sp. TaxID=3060597 RepID=UPI00272821E2|nr:aminotransferase class III-fold pyridoxal phosphate-dependent enzyme [Candidatus Oleimmundimicrobium sp.]MDO8885991.1 aminotransferase class III-fold pyridoxal phosphate-dependent enzyme [Candidatus Oleimmundimicrobium sp.]